MKNGISFEKITIYFLRIRNFWVLTVLITSLIAGQINQKLWKLIKNGLHFQNNLKLRIFLKRTCEFFLKHSTFFISFNDLWFDCLVIPYVTEALRTEKIQFFLKEFFWHCNAFFFISSADIWFNCVAIN